VVTQDLLTDDLLQEPLVRAAAAAIPGGAAARCGIPSAILIRGVADARRASNVLGAPLPDVVSRLARWAVVFSGKLVPEVAFMFIDVAVFLLLDVATFELQVTQDGVHIADPVSAAPGGVSARLPRMVFLVASVPLLHHMLLRLLTCSRALMLLVGVLWLLLDAH
jgi:hypothetical protein